MATSRPRLREARLAAGIKQAELARRIGVNRSVIGRYEKGLTEPLVTTGVRIAEELGTTANAIWVRGAHGFEGAA